MSTEDDLSAIRDSVAALCARFPGEYWRVLDRERAYPTEFVEAMKSPSSVIERSPAPARSLWAAV